MNRLVAWLMTMAMVGCLGACSESAPGRDEIINKIKSDPRTGDTPDAAAGCIADWYVRYATSADIRAFVEGSADARSPDQIAPDEGAKNMILNCLKDVAGTH
jgi:hypothetical protein